MCAAAWFGAVGVILVWWFGAEPAVGRGAGLTEGARLAGLLAGYVAMVQVLLRARLSIVERGLGTDRINATHRLLGTYLVVLVIGHVVLVAGGYARTARRNLFAQAWLLITDYAYVA